MIHKVKEHKFNIENEATRRVDQLNADQNLAVETGNKAAKTAAKTRKATQKINKAYQKARNKKKQEKPT